MTFDGTMVLPLLLQCSMVDSKKCLSANWAMPYVDSLSELGNETVPTARSSPGKIVKCKEIFFSKSIKIGWAIITIRRNTKNLFRALKNLKSTVVGNYGSEMANSLLPTCSNIFQHILTTSVLHIESLFRVSFPNSALVQTQSRNFCSVWKKLVNEAVT